MAAVSNSFRHCFPMRSMKFCEFGDFLISKKWSKSLFAVSIRRQSHYPIEDDVFGFDDEKKQVFQIFHS